MGRVVILEGPDGSGKTTLARTLCTEHDFDYKHEGPPPQGRDQIEYYKVQLYNALEAPHDTVFDRLFLGETVYGPAIRGFDGLGIDGLKLFERVISSKSVWQFICMPDEKTIIHNYTEHKMRDPHDYVKGYDNLKKIINAYYRMLLRPSVHVFNYETDSVEHVLDTVSEPFKPLPKGMIGSPTAKYLFIGDVPNHKFVDWPFFALTNSSGYFNKALEIANFKEEDIAFTNAFSPTGEEHDPFSINDLPDLKQIFLMGARAQEWFVRKVNSVNVNVAMIPHPSYIKRFQGTNPQKFADLLKGEQWHT